MRGTQAVTSIIRVMRLSKLESLDMFSLNPEARHDSAHAYSDYFSETDSGRNVLLAVTKSQKYL